MDITQKAADIKLLVLDVDGVLTDGTLLYSANGEEMKAFDVKDGLGIRLVRRWGIEVSIISGRSSAAVERRAEELGIAPVVQGTLNKIEAFDRILDEKNLDDRQVCTVGDDVTDVPLMVRSGLSFSVPEGVDEARRVADRITRSRAGHGAVREVCEFLLKAQGFWEQVVNQWCSASSGHEAC